jgi:ribosomal protein L7/L12
MTRQCRACGRVNYIYSDTLCYECFSERSRERHDAEKRHWELLEALKTPAQRRAEAREEQRREAEEVHERNERFKSFKIKIQDVRGNKNAREGAFLEAADAMNKIRAGEEICVAGTYCIKLDYTHEKHANRSKYGYWFGDKSEKRFIKEVLEKAFNSGNEIPNLLENVANGDVFFKLEISNKDDIDAFKKQLFYLQEQCGTHCVSVVWLEHIIISKPSGGMDMKALGKSSAYPISRVLPSSSESKNYDAAVATVSHRTSEPIQTPTHKTVDSTNPAENNFSIFLQGDVDADRKISIIGVIRRITKMGLADTKNFVEQEGMRLIQRNLSKQEADEMKQKIEAVGGTVIVSTGTTN